MTPHPDETFPRRFARMADLHPDRVAVRAGEASLSYGELHRRAGRLAARLRRLGVGCEAPVAVLCGRSVEAVVAILGALRAGGCFVPLEAAQPRARLRAILQDLAEDRGGPPVVTVERLRGRLDGAPGRPVSLDEEEAGPVETDDPAPPAESLAYILFTSGTTGRPKGVMVRHGALANLFAALREAVHGASGGPLRVSVNAPLVFDASVKQLIQLAAGHTLEMVPDAVRPDGAALLRFLDVRGVEVLDCTPAQLRLLLEAGLDGSGAVRRILVGGEEVDPALWDRLAALADPECFNVYGPTECTVDVTAAAIGPGDGGPTLGRPLANVEVRVADRELSPVPDGAEGELVVGGAGLARGYRGSPARTAERFVPDPWSGRPGSRVYRTGDLVRARPDGRLEFAGRVDHQVKVRGYRIELGEVEAALVGAPGVVEAVAAVREDEPGDPRLVGYAVLLKESSEAGGTGEAERALREHLRATLPDYMVPTDLVFLDRLPQTPNGKIDRVALPVPSTGSGGAADAPASDSPFEAVLAGIWSEVLRRDVIDREDDFFDLGGHSLLAVQVLSRARAALGVELPFAGFLDHPTLGGLAAALERASRRGDGVLLPPLEPVPRDGELELAFPQEQIWRAELRSPGTDRFNCPHPVRVRGPLRPSLLRRTLGRVVARHEALRTRIVEEGGVPRQVIDPPGSLPFLVVDLTGLPEARREGEARRRAAEEGRGRFDLATGPLLRVALLRLAPADSVVLFTLHHAVTDAWSVEVLVKEVSALYLTLAMGGPPEAAPLSPLPIQYADYAAWQRRCAASGVFDDDLGYWRERLRGAPDPPLPFDRPPTDGEPGGEALWVDLPRTLADGLKALCRSESATLSMGLLAGLQALLWRTTGEPDVVVGTPVAGRPLLEVEPLIGFFVNLLVLRTDLSDGPSLRELLRRARATVLEAYAHQGLPHSRLAEELAPEGSDEPPPLFRVMYTMVDRPAGGVQAPGLSLEPFELGLVEPVEHDLMFGVLHDGSDLFAELKYDPARWDEATVRGLGERYGELLEAAVAEPDRPLAEIGAGAGAAAGGTGR